MKIGAVTPGELRTVCEKGLLLVTITIPEMEVSFIFFTDQFCGHDFTSLPGPIISFSILFAVLPRKMSYIAIGLSAYPLAFSVEDDYTTDIHWCCCHGKSAISCIFILQKVEPNTVLLDVFYLFTLYTLMF